jgi:CHASE3 domain sensor protein
LAGAAPAQAAAALTLVLLSVVVLAVVARASVRNRDDANDLGRRADVTREQLAQLDAALSDQETGQRGFLLTGERSFLEPYLEGQRREAELVEDLHGHDDDLVPIRGHVDAVSEAAARCRK